MAAGAGLGLLAGTQGTGSDLSKNVSAVTALGKDENPNGAERRSFSQPGSALFSDATCCLAFASWTLSEAVRDSHLDTESLPDPTGGDMGQRRGPSIKGLRGAYKSPQGSRREVGEST